MSKLLLDENPLMILPQLAIKIGLNEAIVLQQVHYWLLQKEHQRDGRYWVYNTYEKWQENFPFWSIATTKRALTALRKPYVPKEGDQYVKRPPLLIATSKYNAKKYDKTLWYTIDYEALDSIEDPQVKMTQGSKCPDGSGQDDPMEEDNLTQPIPETSTETTPETTKEIPASPKNPDEPLDDQAEAEPFDAGTEKMWEQYREAEANQKAGGNYAVPPTAGGDDSAAHAGIVALAKAKGSSPPKRGSGGYAQQLEKFNEALKDQGEQDPKVAALAAQMLVKEKPAMANPYYRSFRGDYGDYLGRARGQLSEIPDRHSRYDTPNVQASQAAFKERQAARPPPAEDDKVGQAVKRELELQMSKPTFDTWVRRASFACDDGVLTVTAPDETVKGWLENRLATTIQRTAVGVAGKPVEVAVEVGEA
jgi:hypothetical protein